MPHVFSLWPKLRVPRAAARGRSRGVPPAMVHVRTLVLAILLLPVLAPAASAAFRFKCTSATSVRSPIGAHAIGDMNEDGRTDLLMVSTPELLIAIATPASSYTPQVAMAFSGHLEDLVVGDLDRDGHLDVVVSESGTDEGVYVGYGDGLGHIGRVTRLAAPATPMRLALADLNQDGWPDIVCGASAGVPGVFLSDAAGGFRPRIDVPSSPYPVAVATGDLDGDGHVDLVIGYSGSAAVTWLHGRGDGTFADGANLQGANSARMIRIADATGDGHPDIIEPGLIDHRVVILPGDGAGAFAAPVVVGGLSAPTSVDVADLDADGRPDLAVCDPSGISLSIRLFRGTAAGFVPDRDLFGGFAQDVHLPDIDGDGLPDVMYASEFRGAATLVVKLGTVAPFIVPSVSLAASPEPSLPGEQVRMEVQIVPSEATGVVRIRERARTLGTLVLGPDGRAALVTTFTEPGLLPLVALYDGDDVYSPQASDPTEHEIGLGRVGLAVEFEPALPYEGQAITLRARVTARAPSTGAVAGSVQWRLDGAAHGAPVPVLNGVASTPPTRDLREGVHLMRAVYLGSAQFAADSTADVSLSVGPPRRPVDVALSVSAEPSQRGELVALVALVTPAEATGSVEFLGRGGSLGVATLTLGRAVIPFAFTTAPDTVLLTARYSGDDIHSESESGRYAHAVTRTRVHTVLSAIPAQVPQGLGIVFRVVVNPVLGGIGQPQGTVGLGFDGGPDEVFMTLSQGSALSSPVRSLAPGVHHVRARYAGDSGFAGDTSATVDVTVLDMTPRLHSVTDVPDDQGGRVRVEWRMPVALPGLPYLRTFELWQGRPQAAGAAGFALVHTLAADTATRYAVVVPAHADSTAGGVAYETFFVRGLTPDPAVYFDSPPDSGYSVDNLGPPGNSRFVLSVTPAGAELHWAASAAPDFREFHVHRAAASGFVADAGNLLVATTDTMAVFTEDPARPWYQLVAVDVHGNQGRALEVGPGRVSTELAPLVSLERFVDHLALTWQLPGAHMSALVYRRVLSDDWSLFAQRSADDRGRLRFEDFEVRSGFSYQYRIGVLDVGTEVFSTPTAGTTLIPELALRRVWPTPARGGVLNVELALPDGTATSLDVIDIGGRVVRREQVGGLGAGRHTYGFSTRSLRPGVYLLRMVHGADRFTRRAVVLP